MLNELYRCIARSQSPFELSIFHCLQNLAKSGPRSIPGCNQVVAADQHRRPHLLRRNLGELLLQQLIGTQIAVAGQAIGAMVTLRGDRMYEFFDRLVNVALPRVRDFRGISTKSFDGRGNYTLGIKDQLIFPEIDYSKVDKTKGMNISITTTARTDAEGVALLRQMGMPFRQ